MYTYPAKQVTLKRQKMNSETLAIILALAALLALSGFFSASETAFSSLNRIKLKNMAAGGNKRAALVLKIAENYEKLLSTVLIGNNIVNIASSALGTILFVGIFGRAGVPMTTLIMTILVLLFGEISPKTLAKETPERVSMRFAPILRIFIWIFGPLNHIFTLWKGFVLKIFRVSADRGVTEAELLTFVEEVRQEGGINQREEDMIRRTIEFDDLTANDIVTPRVDLTAIEITESPERIGQIFYDTGFSRLPVYRETIDTIVGIILLKDYYHFMLKEGRPLESVLKPAIFVAKSIKIPRLLKTLQEKKAQLAVLIDEFGGTVGIITIEDIVEELVGEIWDEHDNVVEDITLLETGAYRVLGRTALKDVLALFSIEESEEKTGATTAASWVLENLDEIPREGDTFSFQDLRIKVTKTKRHRVMEIEVRR
jgi:CBS domain containing-hemolysin-like protein